MTSLLFPWFRPTPPSGCTFTNSEHDDRTTDVRYPERGIGELRASWGTLVAMRTLRSVVGTVIVTALLLSSTGPAVAMVERAGEQSVSAAEPSVRADWRERMLLRLNAVRAAAGAPPVRMCPALTRSAQAYARQMARDNRFSHTGADGSTTGQRISGAGYRPVVVGENLAAGQPTVARAMEDWHRSATHYAAMTDARFRHVGFGYEPGTSLRYATFWVQHFGRGGSCA